MKTQKGQTLTVTIWGSYEFKIYLPKSTSSTPYLYYFFKNPETLQMQRIKRSKGIDFMAPLKQMKHQARAVSENIIKQLQDGYNPITNTYPTSSYSHTDITPSSTIYQCMQYWLQHRRESLNNGAIGYKAFKNNGFIIRYFKEWLTSKNYLMRIPSSFTVIDISSFLQTYTKLRGWGKVSYNSYRTDLGTFFNFMVALKIVQDNPVKLTKKEVTKYDSSRFKIFEEEELLNVVQKLAIDKNYFGLYVASKLVYKYNIRPLELTRLQVQDIDFIKRVMILPPSKTKNGSEARFGLDDELFELLKSLIKNSPLNNYVFGGRNTTSSAQVSPDYFGQKWRYFRKDYNIPHHLKYYALKHTSNYYDLQDGASFEEIRQRNRHSNLQVTTLYVKERLFKNLIKPSYNGKF